MFKHVMIKTFILALACSASIAANAVADDIKPINVPAGELGAALRTLAKQVGVEFFYQTEQVKGLRTKGITGTFTAEEAVTKLLEGTPLKLKKDPSGAMLIALPRLDTIPLSSGNASAFGSGETPIPLPAGERARARGTHLAQATNPTSHSEVVDPRDSARSSEQQGQQLPAPEDRSAAIPEVLVKGSKVLNMDIRRTRDDPQPYVVFDREKIALSGVRNLDEFLKLRLPMNTVALSNSQASVNGTSSSINLRGLGTDETLILIDGRRAANSFSPTNAINVQQPDINGIPLSAVERIEVLPATASGIYGGNATGGAINIIMRRDYSGAEVKLNYTNGFDSDAPGRRIDFAGGLNFEGGKSNLLMSGTWSDQDALEVGEQDFPQQYYATAFANNPASFTNRLPFGATPNIRTVDGSPLRLDNGTVLPAAFTYVPYGYAGPSTDGGVALIANAGSYNLDTANSAEGANNSGRRALVNAPTTKSLNATLRRQFSSNVEAFLEAGTSESDGNYIASSLLNSAGFVLPGSASTNPFQQSVVVKMPAPLLDSQFTTESSDHRFVGGVVVGLPGSWQTAADYTWSESSTVSTSTLRLSTAGTAALSNGTFNVLRDPNTFPLDFSPYLVNGATVSLPFKTTLKDAAIRIAGPIGSLPGGAPTLSLLLEHRDELLHDGSRTDFSTANNTPSTTFYPHKSQSVDSVYLELKIPLVSAGNRIPFVQELEVQVAGRHDDYTTEVASPNSFNITTAPNTAVTRQTSRLSSTDPTFGVRWAPSRDIALRASYGTGFLFPAMSQLSAPTFTAISGGTSLFDPRRGNTPFTLVQGQLIGGGNPNLGPEESESLSAGMILTPRFVEGLRLSIDYVNIEKTDNIGSIPGGPQGVLNLESAFPERVTRATPSAADIAMGWAGPVTQIVSGFLNLSKAEVEAFDVQLDYQLDAAQFGRFDFYALATYQPHLTTQILEGLPVIETAGFLTGPVKLKGNAGMTWSYRGWLLGWNTSYWDSYLIYRPTDTAAIIDGNILTQSASEVDEQMYHDAFVSYQFDASGGAGGWASEALRGLEIQLGVRNVLGKEPPRELDTYSTFGDPRVRSYWVNLTKQFGQ